MNNLQNQQGYIDRPPRIQPPLPHQVVEIPPPPDKQARNQSFAQILLPLMSIFGYSLISVFGGGRNILFMIPMGLSIVATTSFSVYSYLQERKRMRELTKAYDDRLRMMRSEMESAHNDQRLYYEHTHPQSDTIKEIGSSNYKTRIGERLWERRTYDHDFMSLRLGMGDIASEVIYEFKNQGSVDEDSQVSEALQLAEDSQILTDAPVIIPLRNGNMDQVNQENVIRGRHSMGFSGKPAFVTDVVRAHMMQLTAFHAPGDFHIYVLGTPMSEERWQWAKWLPHTNANNFKEGDRMCFQEPLHEDEDPKKTKRMYPKRFLSQINKQLEDRRLLMEEKDGDEPAADARSHPFILLIVDNLPNDEYGIDTHDWLDNLTVEPAIASILNNGQTLNAGVIFLVPQNAKIPSDCQAVCEISVVRDVYNFRYSEIGQNTPRYIGVSDHVTEQEAENFARAISDKQMRQSYGSDLRKSISILELFDSLTIEELTIVKNWDESKQRGKGVADWLRVPIGVRSGGDIHEVYFNQDYDGVHGMIAGTTGSGKSEMLLTLIAGLAMKYDPSILNFVLVDYKGGSAFKPFETLPHCVDIVTNLDGKAVDRMFVAIDSELKRRSKMLADYNVKHIVEYREKGYHITQEPFPHLFIVVDEFAEMINENKEYKNHFDSITRLGRAIGVNLILATQRPSNVVSDQMRANMKLRICLRVETGDDSRELLGTSDAMFLPSTIPGRAYLQVGKEALNLLQVARAGGEYEPPKDDNSGEDIIILTNTAVPSVDDEVEKPTIVDLIVGETIDLAKKFSLPQSKPWPDPLPQILPLNEPIDATHLNTMRTKMDNKIVLHPRLRAWMALLDSDNERAKQLIADWQNSMSVDWGARESADTQNIQAPLQTPIGLIDLPDFAEQRIMSIDLTAGPIVVFGAGGWGKTTFLKTLILSLASTHSPNDLWIYVMDFARGGLDDLSSLPHMETAIDVVEEARIERLLRMLSNMLDERGEKVRQYGSLVRYNAANPDTILPGVLVVIDNFAEFKETYENKLPDLTALVRDGRALGIYFVVTADQVNALPSKLYNLFIQRLTLKMADAADYAGIVGRAIGILSELPGRGAVSVEREPREFHVGVITEVVKRPADEMSESNAIVYDSDYSQYYGKLARLMQEKWAQPTPVPTVNALNSHIDLRTLEHDSPPPTMIVAPIGIRDIDRKTAWMELVTHCSVLGSQVSGKTTLLHSAIISLCQRYSPDELALVLIDPTRKLFNYRLVDNTAKFSLDNLPHVLQTVSEPEEIPLLKQYLDAEFQPEVQQKIREHAQNEGIEDVFLESIPQRHLLIIIDNYDDMADFDNPKFIQALAVLARKYRDRIHVIVSGTPEILRQRDDLIKRVDSARNVIVLQSTETVRNLGGKTYNLANDEMPVGRGFMMKSGKAQLFQTAMLAEHSGDNYAAQLDAFVGEQVKRYKDQNAKWYFQGSVHLLGHSTERRAIVPDNEPVFEDVDIEDDIAAEMERIMGKKNTD